MAHSLKSPNPTHQVAAAAFKVAAAARRPRIPGRSGARAFHPDGLGYSARLTLNGSAAAAGSFLGQTMEHDAVMRLSRAAGLPEFLPDVLGIAFRLPDVHGEGRHQDLLFASSARQPILRHALLPGVGGFFGSFFTTLTPYRVGGELRMLGIGASNRDGSSWRLDRTVSKVCGRGFALCCAEPRGPWHVVGELTASAPLALEKIELVRFNPHNTGGGLEPAGPFQDLREPSYDASQAARLEWR